MRPERAYSSAISWPGGTACHWSFARCVQIPDEAGLARWERMRAQQIERMQARAEKAAAEADGKA